MTSILESAEFDASESIGSIYITSHRDALRDWPLSPGPDSRLLVDTAAANTGGQFVRGGTSWPGWDNGTPSSRALYAYVPIFGDSGTTDGVLEVATAARTNDASVSQKQGVFFVITVFILAGIGYMLIVVLTGRRHHRSSNKAGSMLQGIYEPGHRDTENAYEIRSELVAKFSHEIRTPLNAVLGMADLLRLTQLTRKQHTYVHTIQSSGEMLLSLIENVLDFSKIETDTLDLQEHEFDIVRLIDDVLYIMGYFANTKGIELIGDIRSPIDLRVICDKRRLRQILINLIGNAIKYTNEGEITVVVDCTPDLNSQCELQIRVLDTGIGISPSIRQRLFLPFVSGIHNGNTANGSTGLGLAICKRLVEHMKGQIELDDREGGGTIAGFSIPIRCVRQTDSLAFGRPDNFPDHVLIAHQNRAAADGLRRLLDCWNVPSQSVSSARDIVKQLQHAAAAGPTFDAVILDSDLEGGDRLDRVREIRATRGFEKLPIILLMPITESLEFGEISTLGPTRCITKPVLSLQLRDYLEDVLTDDADESPVDIDDAFPHPRNPMKILIAEDNQINAQLLLKMLQSEGHKADVVTDGLAVLEAVRETTYDLILMDCQMPEMDGDEVTRKINSNSRQYHVPALIVAITADTTDQTRTRCFESGMDDFLVKPIRLDKLRKGLARWSLSIFGIANSTPTRPEVMQVRSNLRGKMGTIDADFLGSYIELFLEDTDRRLETLAESVSRGDMTIADRGCHALKGGCMEFGAERMSRLCEEMSVAAKSGDSDAVQTLFSRLQKEYLRLRPVYESAVTH
jgi:signal transduction histidine kinase/DNA-binding response OmpR family regulator/HPt (histidine-containing phosphotransfer) domain-containing protein